MAGGSIPELLDGVKAAAVDVEHVSLDGVPMREEGAGYERFDRCRNSFEWVGETSDRPAWFGTRFRHQVGEERLIVETVEATLGVLDDEHLTRAEFALRKGYRSNDIVGDEAPSVAQDMDLSDLQAKHLIRIDPTVHAGDNDRLMTGCRVERGFSQLGEFVALESDELRRCGFGAHRSHSVANLGLTMPG